MRNSIPYIFLPIFVSSLNAFAAQPTKELSWSSVNLKGAHLQLVSPKEKDQTVDLNFGASGNLSISSCNKGTCAGPLIPWKIDNNQLRTGYAPDEGAALIGVSGNKLTLREPSGKIVVYAIVNKP